MQYSISPSGGSGGCKSRENPSYPACFTRHAEIRRNPLGWDRHRWRSRRVHRRHISIYWEFIENFYQLHFIQLFFQPTDKLGLVCPVNAVFAGRTDLAFAVWWHLRVFFFLVRLNKHLPVADRIKISQGIVLTARRERGTAENDYAV